MRIAYICYGALGATDGPALKISAQLAAWRAAGHEACLFSLSNSRETSALPYKRFLFDSNLERFVATATLSRAVKKFEPDLVYLRYDRFLPPLGALLRRFPTVVELNGDDREEARLKSRRALLYNGLNRWALLRKACGIVCVTRELAGSGRVASFGTPTVVIANGVDLTLVPHLSAPVNGRPRLAFLGRRGEPWQGIDKVVALARRLQDCDFDVVGFTARELPTPLPENLRAHGRLSRAEYEPLLATADVGIGTLALHRKCMDEASPLKVREYLAHGLPVITAYIDTDFADGSPWFMLRLPNTEDNIDPNVATIRSFVQRVRGRRVPRDAVDERIGAEMKEQTRLAFMRRLISPEPAHAPWPVELQVPPGTVADLSS